MVCVWPPQISMIVHGRVTFLRIAATSCSAALGSRYSLTNFTELLFYVAHLPEVLEDALGFFLVDDADGEADVDQDILADLRFRRVSKVDVFADAAKVDLPQTKSDVAGINDFDDFSWNGETHQRTSAAKAANPFSRLCGTTEVVPFPCLYSPNIALASRHYGLA